MSAQPPPAPLLAASADPASNLPAQKVGAGDLLSISVADCPELSRNFRISSDGTLPLPLLKHRLHVAGEYPSAIEQELSDELIREQILVSPIVSVSVAEYRSVPVSVVGAVRHPVIFQAVGEVTLLDALARADGLGPDAGPEILVGKRLQNPDGTSKDLLRRIPVKGLLDGADPSLNIGLSGGEEIRVPEAGKVYVVGNVKKSGAFAIEDGGDTTTVLKMIALSEGLLPFASKTAYIYRREGGAHLQNEIPIQLSEIMDRKAPDVTLQPDDILYIPDNKHRRMTMTTLDRLAGFGAATTSGVLIFH